MKCNICAKKLTFNVGASYRFERIGEEVKKIQMRSCAVSCKACGYSAKKGRFFEGDTATEDAKKDAVERYDKMFKTRK